MNAYSAAYPYESVYTLERRLLMQEARAEVLLRALRAGAVWKRGAWNRGARTAWRWSSSSCITTPCGSLRAPRRWRRGDEDEAVEQLRTQRTFLHDHLLNWLPLLTNDMRLFSRTLFYQGLAQLCHGLRRGGCVHPSPSCWTVWKSPHSRLPETSRYCLPPAGPAGRSAGPGSFGPLHCKFFDFVAGFRKRGPVHQAFSFHGE